jgi:hypothetical protein
VTRTIQFILAPVVMVSTCAILLGNLMNRYALIGDRLRALAKKHRDLAVNGVPAGRTAQDAPAAEWDPRLREIDAQIPSIWRRHRLLRRSVVFLNYAPLVFFIDMLAIALAALETSIGWVTGLAMLNFLIGIAFMAWSVLLSTLEARTSHLAMERDLSWFASAAPGTGAHGEAQMRALLRSHIRRNKAGWRCCGRHEQADCGASGGRERVGPQAHRRACAGDPDDS